MLLAASTESRTSEDPNGSIVTTQKTGCANRLIADQIAVVPARINRAQDPISR
jgi:hypothetical protein